MWLTLPASPRGLTDAGIAAVEQMLQAGVQLTGVNIMTMNYGASRSSSLDMLEAAKAAAGATHDQLGIVYQRAGINLSREQVWKKIGLTPMIGRNDLPGEIFQLDAARGLRDYAVELGVQRLSMWSLNRDAPCPSAEQGGQDAPSPAAAWTKARRVFPISWDPGSREGWAERLPLLHLAGRDHVQPWARRNIL